MTKNIILTGNVIFSKAYFSTTFFLYYVYFMCYKNNMKWLMCKATTCC